VKHINGSVHASALL